MMEFKNFCKIYIKSLSYITPLTLDLKKLGYEAATHTPRLREPVFCYAYAEGRLKRLLATVKNFDLLLYHEYQNIYENTEKSYDKFFVELAKIYYTKYFFDKTIPYSGAEWLPKEYAKVYQAWQAYCCRRSRVIKSKERTREFFKIHNTAYPQLTIYKLIKDLNLNKRNVYAFLAGDNNRISWDTSNKILDYIVDYVDKNENGKILTLLD